MFFYKREECMTREDKINQIGFYSRSIDIYLDYPDREDGIRLVLLYLSYLDQIKMDVDLLRSTKIGKQINEENDFGYLGCYTDVLKEADDICTGRVSCSIPVPNPKLENGNRSRTEKSCPRDFKLYLQASHRLGGELVNKNVKDTNNNNNNIININNNNNINSVNRNNNNINKIINNNINNINSINNINNNNNNINNINDINSNSNNINSFRQRHYLLEFY
ncbi:hypothetical protein HELRODRAFT_184446, partial [Helobdella robusta]|uniref:SUEL-type lectin domain-containing protein n=1 Tax=Helobdella robusta TaxID=6412 RepID=T1FL80_HELRO